MKFRLSGRASFFQVGDRQALFFEPSQQIFELNEAAALLAHRLAEAPASFRQLRSLLAQRGMTGASAARHVGECLSTWSRHGWLKVVIGQADGKVVLTQNMALAGLGAAVRYRSREAANLVAPTFDHLASSRASPSIVYDVAVTQDRAYIGASRSGGVIVALSEAAPALKAALTDDVLASAGGRVVLHAALLVRNARGLLLCGGPGVGKTTLTLALLGAGFDYGADDIVLMNARGRVEGAPFAPALKSGSWKLLKGSLGVADLTQHRRLDGRLVRYVPPSRLAPKRPCPMSTVAILRRRTGCPATITPAEPLAVLRELLAGAFTPSRRLSARQLATMLDAISRASPIHFEFSRLDEAARALSDYHASKPPPRTAGAR